MGDGDKEFEDQDLMEDGGIKPLTAEVNGSAANGWKYIEVKKDD